MKYKVQIGFEHEILVEQILLSFEHEIQVQIGFEHEILVTDRL